MMSNPYAPPGPDTQRSLPKKTVPGKPTFLEQLVGVTVLGSLSLGFSVFVGVLGWFGGLTAIIGAVVICALGILIVCLLIYWFFADTPEQRRQYLREKRRRAKLEKAGIVEANSKGENSDISR